MKVAGSAGVGQYYRHAIAQAVLYREFIKRATPLHWWFDAKDLTAGHCKGAVVVPKLTGANMVWRDGLQRLCRTFDIDLIEVEPASAWLRHVDGPSDRSETQRSRPGSSVCDPHDFAGWSR